MTNEELIQSIQEALCQLATVEIANDHLLADLSMVDVDIWSVVEAAQEAAQRNPLSSMKSSIPRMSVLPPLVM